MMLQCACCQRLVLLLRTINLEQANGNYEEQIDQMQGISGILLYDNMFRKSLQLFVTLTL